MSERERVGGIDNLPSIINSEDKRHQISQKHTVFDSHLYYLKKNHIMIKICLILRVNFNKTLLILSVNKDE